MTIIRKGSLFGIQELYVMEPTRKYKEIMAAIFFEINKKSRFGATTELNYGAMLVSVFARYIERIPTIKDLVKRLKHDLSFKLDCGFKVLDAVPSEASYSRMLITLRKTKFLENVQETTILDAIAATHFEARDKAPSKMEKPKTEPKKRGCKKKEEREQWLAKEAERKANLPMYEKKIEDQLGVPLHELWAEIPQEPYWGVKENSEGQHEYCFGYKGHLAVGAFSQYILQSLFSSGNLNYGKAAIPLL